MNDENLHLDSNLEEESDSEINSVHQVNLDRSWLSRTFWFLLGILVATIGLIGIVVPGLPTTPLMILAAACFAKSSQKFYGWAIWRTNIHEQYASLTHTAT